MQPLDFTIARLAFRNVLRHRARSAIAISAIAFSVVSLLLAGGFVEWIFWALREAAIQTGLGHVQVVKTGYRENGAADPFAYLLPERSADLATIEASPDVKAVAPRLEFSGLVSHGDSTLSFTGEGVDADQEQLVSRVLHVPAGQPLSASDPTGVLLGVGLAEHLQVKPGDPLVLLATSASGSTNAVDAHVRGLMQSEVKAYDDQAIRAPIELARQLARAMGSHVWVVALRDTASTARWVDQMRDRLANRNLQFVPWFDLADFYNKTVTLLSSQMLVVRVIIALIIVLGISNVLVMSVLERTGEIGTLLAIGTRRAAILRQFLWEGLLMGLLGALVGLGAGTALATAISYVGIPMPPPPGRQVGYSAEILLTWQIAAAAFALALITSLLAAVFPAWKASRLAIVDALRHNR